MARNDKLTLSDIDQWIDNDEGLYNWWKRSRQSKRAFIRENRAEIESAIHAMTSGTRHQHFLAYGGRSRGSRSSRTARLHHYYSVIIPYTRRGRTEWHPAERTGPFSTLSRGAFRTQRQAHAWAKLHLGGAHYRLRRHRGA